MPINQDYVFWYPDEPSVLVMVYAPGTGKDHLTWALIDTGTSNTVFDIQLAIDLGLDLSDAPRIRLNGAGGALEGRLALVEVSLLGEQELTVPIEAAFVSRLGVAEGNLIGLDVLDHVDLSLSHYRRLGYLGPASTS